MGFSPCGVLIVRMGYPPGSLTATVARLLQRARPQHGVHLTPARRRRKYAGQVYRPQAFDMNDLDEIHHFVRQAGPAHLVTANGDSGSGVALVSSIVPMLLDATAGEHGSLVGHLARPNQQWRRVSAEVEALAIFTGADAYVSPSMYPTKRETGKVVPTWNYSVVHVFGSLVVHDDPAWVLDLVTRLTDRHEADRDPRWGVDDAPREYIDSMVRGIVGIELVISRFEGKRKLSQNRSLADIDGVIEGLEPGNPASAVVAADMRVAARSRR